jgi:glutamate/tyrosine decarboxylase-like PLP-dependent enzyme
MLGIGSAQLVSVAVDAQGRLSASALRTALAQHDGPAIVCAQAGNVDTGASDPFVELVQATRARGAWLHVDGAFGLWAAVVPALRDQLRGVEGADSWAVDAHKWLNVPYDSGLAIVADARAHYEAVHTRPAVYLVRAAGERDGSDWAPESSRRARAFAIYAVLRALGRAGLETMFANSCSLARALATELQMRAGATILNDVVLNQVLVRFTRAGADDSPAELADADALTDAVITRVQREGVCWVGPSRYRGRVVMRVALSHWATNERDIALSVDSIARAAAACRALV